MRKIKMLKHILFFAFLIISGFAQAQQNRYMVFFSDKANTHHQINEPLSFLSAKAIERRQKQSISITVDDLPVSQAYVQSIKQLGVDVFFTSRWFNAALIQAEADQLTDIQNLAFVSQIEFVAPGERLIRNGRKKLEEDVEDTDLGTTSAKQLIQLGMGEMHADQYKGEGVNIAVIDGGFLGVDQHEYFALMRDQGRLKDTFNFVSNTNNPFSASQHGSMVLSAMAAYKSSDFIGGAYMANYYLYLTEDAPTEYRVEEYNWLFAAERADSAGVDIINTSLGYSWFDDSSMDYTPADMDGQTAVISIAAKMAFDRGMLVVTSAGNYGNNNWQVITAP
ncbi:MAG TPA: S8 family serine peptidase, partial [Cyclobacteriaceae bacterium]|nr:S8 family serine peptidase [Cyclobacteriaceae bacterium]